MLECLQDLLIHILISLAEILSSLGMAKNNVFNTCIYQHVRRNLACISAALLEIHILCSNLDISAFCSLYDRNDIDCRHAEYYVDFVVRY